MPHRTYARQYVIYLTIVCSVPWIVAALIGMGMSHLLAVVGLTLITVAALIIAMVLVTELVAWALKGFWRAIVDLYGWLPWPSLPARQ